MSTRRAYPINGRSTPFPATVTPALWLDGRVASFSDAAGTTPANAPLGRVARVASPIGGNWLSPNTTDARPFRDATGFCFEPLPTTGNYGGTNLAAPAGTTLPGNACTVSGCFTTRSSQLVTTSASRGLVYGADTQAWGPFVNNSLFCAYYNGSIWTTDITIPLAVPVAFVLRYTPTGLDLQVNIGGVISTRSLVTAVTAGTIANITVGLVSTVTEGLHGSMTQVVGVARAITDTERTQLLTWLVTQTPATAFPSDVNLVALSGDSICEGYGLSSYLAWAFSMLPALQAVGPQIKLLNLGVPSDNLAGMQTKFDSTIAPLYSAARAKNVLVVQGMTNSVAFGVNTAAQNITAYSALCAQAKAQGWKVVACTFLPRSDPGIRGTFEADRTTINASIVANYTTYANALCRFDTVAGMGAFGDSDSVVNYQDKVHPGAVGMSLLLPSIQAAVLSLL